MQPRLLRRPIMLEPNVFVYRFWKHSCVSKTEGEGDLELEVPGQKLKLASNGLQKTVQIATLADSLAPAHDPLVNRLVVEGNVFQGILQEKLFVASVGAHPPQFPFTALIGQVDDPFAVG